MAARGRYLPRDVFFFFFSFKLTIFSGSPPSAENAGFFPGFLGAAIAGTCPFVGGTRRCRGPWEVGHEYSGREGTLLLHRLCHRSP